MIVRGMIETTETSVMTDKKNQQEVKRYRSYADIAGRVDVPSIQRDLDVKVVAEMREHIADVIKAGREPIFGAIDLCRMKDRLFVIDGQHRLEALRQEYVESKQVIPFNVVIYNITTIEEMQWIFQIRNKGVPVPEYILNPSNDTKQHALLKEIESYIKTIPLFGSNVKRPAINTTVFMNRFRDGEYIVSIEGIKHFHKLLNMANDIMATKARDSKYRAKEKISDTMYNKCIKEGIYLGLDAGMAWMSCFSEHNTA
jgi:hypothetical protein